MARLDHIQCSEDARKAARRRLPWMVFDFIDGGAGEERTSRRNREALDRIELLPRVLVNVEARRTAIDLLAEEVSVALAQIGRTDIGALDERVLARRAAASQSDVDSREPVGHS